MKNSRRLLAAAVFIFSSFLSNAQVQTPKYNAINGNCGGYYEYLPQGYGSNTSQTYPLIVAVHGIGELGNGGSDLPNLLNCWTAIPRLIANGGFPSSFSVGGQSFSFIVISPQFKAWPSASDVNDVVNYAIQNYRVDQSRIYVTGLSMGGGAVWDFAAAYPTKATAIVPVCGASYPDGTKAQSIANAKLPVWATHNQDDPTVSSSYTTGWVSQITQDGGNAISTIFPVSGHDAWTKTYDPNFTQNGVNIYQWMLQHTKGSASVNQSPTANAGNNQSITLPQNSVSVSGSGSDPDGTIASYQWTQVSGPSNAGISSANSANTSINNLVQGSYVFRLTVTDNQGASASADLTVTVDAAQNQPPSANAGQDQTITLPQNSVTLNGSGTDNDGTIASYQWSQTSGPAQATVAAAASATTTASNLIEGSYVFTLKVTDDKGASATSSVTIRVNPAPNQPPMASAGQNQIITLPANSTALKGSGFDSDGTISSYQWNQASGPSQATIAATNSANTTVTNLTQGTYVFTLTVTDNKGATAKSNVTVVVNNPPIANAGSDQTITLPQNSTILTGFGSDPDGTIASYQWSQVSGPSKADVANGLPGTASIKNLVQGIYSFRLTVIDNYGAMAWDEMTITVLPDPMKKSTASLYPNPAGDFVYIKIDAVTPRSTTSIQITNPAGTVVYNRDFVRTDFREIKQIDISKLSKGIYFVTVTTDINTKKTLTLVKQ